MEIQYRYTRSGNRIGGALEISDSNTEHNQIVEQVLQTIANEVEERILVKMMSSTSEGKQVGTKHFDPENQSKTESSTLEKIEIHIDNDWKEIALK